MGVDEKDSPQYNKAYYDNLSKSLKDSIGTENCNPQITKLRTDQKVLARVTDGIYRLPGSALRELISNSYDADAENVIIHTDVPRFESMTIRDDGNGMSIDTLVNLLGHIGGSAKRNQTGKDLGVTNQENVNLSPVKKRQLIGKIGIGLFSVAQLTRNFEIITKQKGDGHYTKASVELKNYSDEGVERGESFETGEVTIWTEPTDNIEAHGTDIILNDIKRSARDQLQSVDIWNQEELETDSTGELEGVDSSKLDKPSFHIGKLSGNSGEEYYNDDSKPNLPWDEKTSSDEKFRCLYNGILDLTGVTSSPKLNNTLDHYLNMLWALGLSVPLDYIEKHPFNYSSLDFNHCFAISNKHKGQVKELDTSEQPFKDALKLKTPISQVDFNVVVDGIKLFRPLRLTNLPESRAAVKTPIMFIGSYTPNLSGIDVGDSGGQLSFDAYLLWTPKVIPKDHNGSIIRIHNASGIMFDETFMKHQVAEHTIKSQLTVEIFVNKGLESALNIDRESFNISHPHYQIVMRWLHQALRQTINKYKSIKKELTSERRSLRNQQSVDEIQGIVEESYEKRGLDSQEKITIQFSDRNNDDSKVGSIHLKKEDIPKDIFTPKTSAKNDMIKSKTEALVQILDSYRLLDHISQKNLNNLIIDILKITSSGDG
ncbi:MAG: ATP-binding protein [Lentisphaeraceae bacterium]|nr:ATP-binding protein [Lentisphaeraceae bacterium]